MSQTSSRHVICAQSQVRRLRRLLSSVPIRRICLAVALAALARGTAAAQNVSQPAASGTGRTDTSALETLNYPPGRNVPERTLGPRQVDAFRIRLEANTYVHVEATFKAVNGMLVVYAPDGQLLKENSLPTSTECLKTIIWIGQVAGDYRLEVRAVDPQDAGHYEVMIRRAAPNDEAHRKLIVADQETAEAYRLHEIGTSEALRAAIPKLTKAIPLWREVGDVQFEFIAGMYLGEVYHMLSEYQKALEVYEQVLPLVTEEDIRVEIGWVYNNMGSSNNAFGEKEKAIGYYRRALASYERRNAIRGQGIAHTAIGGLYLSLGEKQQALDHLTRAIPFWEKAMNGHPETFGLARVYLRLGEVYASLGENERALGYFKQAWTYWRETSANTEMVRAIEMVGRIYHSEGNLPEALTYFNEALRVARLAGNRSGEMSVLANLGYVHFSLGQHAEALEHLRRSLVLTQEINNPSGHAYALTVTGMIHHAQGDPTRALNLYDEALVLRSRVRDREGKAETLYRKARAHHDINELGRALEETEEALRLVEQVRSSFAGTEMRASYQATVRSYYEFYIHLLMQMHQRNPQGGFDAAALAASERARARSLLDTLAEAGANIREGVDVSLLERERDLARRLGHKDEYQTRLLSGPHTPEQAAAATREVDKLTQQYREVRAQIRAASPRYAALTQPPTLSLNEIQQNILTPDTVLLEYSLGEEHSFLWLITTDALISFELPRRPVIEALARRFCESLSARPRRQLFQTSDPKLARFTGGGMDMAAALELSHMLLGPALPHLGGKRLLIIADGALHYVPFAALPLPHEASPENRDRASRGEPGYQPLIVTNEIVTLPSASTLSALRQDLARRPLAPRAVAVMADPVFEASDPRVKSGRVSRPARRSAPEGARATIDGLARDRTLNELRATRDGRVPRLPSTRREALAIASLVAPEDRVLALDFAADYEVAVNPSLGQHRIIHFATHGIFNSHHPELSGIVLSLVDRGGRPRNGFLRAHEIYNLNLPAELVVLSACQTALGKEVRGEGLLSLTRGFMYAGAARVVSSMWEVDSVATATLMTRFYHAMLRDDLPPPAALRAAQLSLWREKRWQEPYYWAAFSIQGEYQVRLNRDR